ncbi:MAG: hypothetical protein KDK66_03905 [Deltaproteobacteria bacterium]|nr:hypothetical protein [Deltaproteobacteria bacterium]
MTETSKSLSGLFIFSLILIGYLSACGGSSGTSSGATTVDLSGQVAIRSSDLSADLSAQINLLGTPPDFATIGDTNLANAEVSLVQKNADGTEESIATTTTDASGNYTLSSVPICQGGTGASDDFYYEIQVSSGDTTIAAPACPSGDSTEETVNVSPESNLAAKIISEVAKVPGSENTPIPLPETFKDLRNFTEGDVGTLEEDITIPSASDAEASIDMANGMAAAGGDAEKAYKKYQFEAEFARNSLGNNSQEELAAYLARVAKEGCESGDAVLPQAAADVMAEALAAGTTFTPQEIVTAFNTINPGDPADAATKVAEYSTELESIEAAQASEVTVGQAALDSELNLGVFYTQRNLASDTLSETSELAPDQAMAFIEKLGNTDCNLGNTNITQLIGTLTENTALQEPQIEQVVIYNDSGFNCDSGSGLGHFIATVDVYLPAGEERTITSVVITSTDSTALGGNEPSGDGLGTITLTQQGASTHFVSQTDPNTPPSPGDCVTLDQEVTYTVTVTLSDASTITDTVVRTHPETQESVISMNGNVLAQANSTPAVTTDKRPLISWTPPEDILAAYEVTPPEGSQVKYSYEFSHYNLDTDNFITGETACAFVNSGSAFYSTNSFIPTVDCDPEACAAAVGTTADRITCRINIQTYLLDAFDQLQSQAAGSFRQICVDLDGDDNCG